MEGLGLRSARNMSMAMMMKAGWNVCHRKQDMWVKIVEISTSVVKT